MDVPLTISSIIVFILTLGVGYVILFWAYLNAERLDEWYVLDSFDKTFQTLVIGGSVTLVSLIFLNAPWSYLPSETTISSSVWWNWFWNNLGAIAIVEATMIYIVTFILQTYLSRTRGMTMDYVR
jgi:hypothetical protein